MACHAICAIPFYLKALNGPPECNKTWTRWALALFNCALHSNSTIKTSISINHSSNSLHSRSHRHYVAIRTFFILTAAALCIDQCNHCHWTNILGRLLSKMERKLLYAFRGWIAFVAFMDFGTAFRSYIEKRSFLGDPSDVHFIEGMYMSTLQHKTHAYTTSLFLCERKGECNFNSASLRGPLPNF